ncbi:hypothetical protein M422DRAFT_780639 [Sphaerobolus stellatus SS14]|uniref:Ndc10 domain-containing protein n=1 Tax=Sphaerobolus stellatus (strain SS14) TaxID=990650 RepID=A0A0C9VHF6_SPHS4|nr:hypothetical protein M422DRAFT_780639 [Sphaerobolus stellatus SS14]
MATKKAHPTPKGRKIKSSLQVATLHGASNLLKSSVTQYGKSVVTTQKYAQCIVQGQKWLKELLKSEESLEHPPGCPDFTVEKEWTNEELAGAFGKIPTCASAYILSLLIACKCFGDNCGKSTAQANLRYKDLELGLQTADDHKLPYFMVSLEDRKNWKYHTSQEDILHDHQYEIHDQPELPGINMYFHFLRWLAFLQQYIYCRGLQSDDYIFPAIGANGIAQPGSPISHDTIQKWLDEFGGAQHRFMEAPIGKCWSLSIIRWWGGWAQGEHRDTLLWYLVDEINHFEEGHRDALRPCLPETKRSFLGEHEHFQVPNKLEIQQIFHTEVASATQTIFQNYEKLFSTLLQTVAPLTVSPNSADATSVTGARYGEYRNLRHATVIHGPVASLQISGFSQPKNSEVSVRDLTLPNIDKKVPMSQRWQQVIKDWYNSDPSWNHHIPLKDWKQAWITELRGTLAQKYYDRKLIVQQYECCNSDDAEFLRKWPMTVEGPTALLNAINKKRRVTGDYKYRSSKKGKQETRSKE